MRTIVYSKITYVVCAVLSFLLISLIALHLRVNLFSPADVGTPEHSDEKAVKNVAFIKIHKCASSTLSNILYRYGVCHNLTFLLPRNERLAQFWPFPIKLSDTIANCKKKFNILNVHSKFQGRKQLEKSMPSSTKIIAILRHPASQLKSALNYYASKRSPNGKVLTFSEFIDAPAPNIKSNPTLNGVKDLLWNGMSNDLGLMKNKGIPWGLTKKEILSNSKYKKYVFSFIASVEQSIDLMLIVEQFDQSMVLLQRFLHWDLEDVTYFSLNKAKETVSLEKFTQSEIDKVISWNFIDYLLYVRMFDKFLDLIYSPDYDIAKEAAALASLNAHYEEECIGKTEVDSKLYGANAIIGYTLSTEGQKKEKCKRMATNELDSVEEMRLHMKSICKNTKDYT